MSTKMSLEEYNKLKSKIHTLLGYDTLLTLRVMTTLIEEKIIKLEMQ